MKSAALCIDKPAAADRRTGYFSDWAKRTLLSRLRNIRHGELVLNDADEQYHCQFLQQFRVQSRHRAIDEVGAVVGDYYLHAGRKAGL